MRPHRSDVCPHCNAKVTPGAGAALRYTVLLAAWMTTMASVFCGILLGPGIAVILPVLAVAGMSLVGTAHAWAFGDRVCSSCGKAYELDGDAVPAVAAVA